MSTTPLVVRKIFSQVDEAHLVSGTGDGGAPLRKVAVCAVVTNPYAGKGYVADLSELVTASGALGTRLGSEAARLLEAPVESYGKGGLAGSAGEQEHINAALTSVFGDAFREAIGGGKAWLSSATKMAGPGAVVDIPLAYKDDIWVRSHYDAVEIRVPDAPRADELVIMAVVANRGRINARVGGRTVADVKAAS